MPVAPEPNPERDPSNQVPASPGKDGRDFHLTKWYLDAADAQGNVYIGYHAALYWRSLRLKGHHHLWHLSDDGRKTVGGLSKQATPRWEGETRLVWHPVGLQGEWVSAADGIDEVLFSADQGEITWRCTQPKALAHVESPDYAVTGWGYTERLDLSVPVWRLPFKVLYWGRCHSANHYVVWIQWDGATHQQLAWRNGRRTTGLSISAARVLGADFRVDLLDPVPVRQGVLASTVFRSFTRVARLLPRAALMADERKWYSRGRIQTATGTEPATIIYEEVHW